MKSYGWLKAYKGNYGYLLRIYWPDIDVGNSFTTIATPLGTNPVAVTPSDTLTLTSTSGTMQITGNAVADTVNYEAYLGIGKAGGQSAIGGTGASENLTLSSTTNVTKGKILLGTLSAYDQVNDRLGLGQTTPVSKLDITTNSLGTTQTQSSGVLLANNTAATVGAQQISPAIRFLGSGWKTNAVAAAQNVEFRMWNLPAQATTAPTGRLKVERSINGGGYAEVFAIGSGGDLYLSGSAGTIGNFPMSQGAGNPVLWTQVNLSNSNSVTGNLPVTNLNSGVGAGSGTYWDGTGAWSTPPGPTSATPTEITTQVNSNIFVRPYELMKSSYGASNNLYNFMNN